MAQIINGKEISKKIREEIKISVASLREKGTVPGLAVILVGNDPASAVYVRNKQRACEEVDILSQTYTLPENTSQEELLSLIEKLNRDPGIHGILTQMPLPRGIDEGAVIRAISPEKDVDAFHPENVGKIMIGDYDFLPCTPAGIMALLKYSGISCDGKRCVVIGRSNIVGKPMAMLMLHANGTVTVCHSHTRDLAKITREADILIAAVGKAGFVTGDMVKENAVVIDVGMNRLPDGKLTGDVDFDAVGKKSSFITPVPGGVGPMTITMLLKNTVKSAQRANERLTNV